MTMPHDYSGHLDSSASPDKLELLTALARVQLELETQVAEKEEELKELKSRHREVAQQQIPLLMLELGVSQLKLANGAVITVEDTLRVSVPKKNITAAMAWLNSNGLASIVKRAFVIKFGRDDERWAAKFERDCKQRKKPLDIERTERVEPSTLKKNLQDLRGQGVDVPLELFGAYEQREAKIRIK